MNHTDQRGCEGWMQAVERGFIQKRGNTLHLADAGSLMGVPPVGYCAFCGETVRVDEQPEPEQ